MPEKPNTTKGKQFADLRTAEEKTAEAKRDNPRLSVGVRVNPNFGVTQSVSFDYLLYETKEARL